MVGEGEVGAALLLLLMVSMIVANSKEKKWETVGDRRERKGFGITTEKDFAALGYFSDV